MSYPAEIVCDGPTFAGLDYSVVGLVALALAIAAVGVALLITRRRRSRVSVSLGLLLLLAMGVGAVIASPTAAHAAASACVAPAASVTVTQTSIITGLAPGSPAVPITGVITNKGTSDIVVTEVFVSISRITGTLGTGHRCGASDFVITGARTRVDMTLSPGASSAFSGALIGFVDRAFNQDSCKRSALQLRYEFSGS